MSTPDYIIPLYGRRAPCYLLLRDPDRLAHRQQATSCQDHQLPSDHTLPSMRRIRRVMGQKVYVAGALCFVGSLYLGSRTCLGEARIRDKAALHWGQWPGTASGDVVEFYVGGYVATCRVECVAAQPLSVSIQLHR